MKHSLKTQYQVILYSLFCALHLISCGNTKKSTVQTNDDSIPGYNEKAITVNSIAPDRGLADPHNIIVGDTLYVMCGHDRDWNITKGCQMDRWELWATTNLTDWEYILNIPSEDTYIGDKDDCFAGDIATKNGKFYWYFSNRTYSTGVMEAPSMRGPWKDALGKPLIPENTVPTKCYDPEVYEDNGVHYILFGAGQYYIAKLGDDMISLAEKPQKIVIKDADGKNRVAADKSSIFKRGDWYYLSWGDYYAMSKKLHGPYLYKGKFIDGGHGSMFEWKNQWYYIQENHETNAFYRGVHLNPLYFYEDGTVYIPKYNHEYPHPGRFYNFEHSVQGWRAVSHTDIKRDKPGEIYGTVNAKGAIISSVAYLNSP